MTIWQFNRRLSRRLLFINMINTYIGTRLAQRENFWQGFGIQAVTWGMINISIALFGLISTGQRHRQLEAPLEPEIIRKETRSIRRVLAFNAPMNLVYMRFGLWLVQRYGSENPRNRGHGWGIIFQGFMLLLFDSFHLRQVLKLGQEPKMDQA